MTFYVHVYEMQTIFEDVFFFSPLVFDVSCVFGEWIRPPLRIAIRIVDFIYWNVCCCIGLCLFFAQAEDKLSQSRRKEYDSVWKQNIR